MSTYSYVDNRPMARVSPNGVVSEPPPATEGCGPGITLCSLRKLASEACPPPMFPYGGLPGFKDYWLEGYYAVCEGQRGMLREQLGIGARSQSCGDSWPSAARIGLGAIAIAGGGGMVLGGARLWLAFTRGAAHGYGHAGLTLIAGGTLGLETGLGTILEPWLPWKCNR